MGLTMSVGLGMVSVALKAKSRGAEIPDIEDWVAQGIDQSGILGITFDIDRILMEYTNGSVGLSMFAAEAGIDIGRSRYYSAKDAYETFLGSALGLPAAAASLGVGVGDLSIDPKDAANFRRIAPLWSLWYLRWLTQPALTVER